MLSNPQNQPAVEAHKAKISEKAATFARESKRILRTPKRQTILSLMANYGVTLTVARKIYNAA